MTTTCVHGRGYACEACDVYKKTILYKEMAERQSYFERQAAYTNKPNVVDPLVHKPAHYRAGDIYETIKVIEAWGLDKDYLLANTIKYISRHDKKDNPIQDLEKARWYLDRKIENLKKSK